MTRFTPQWLQSGSYAASQDRRLIGALWPTAASSGCQVSAGSGMTVYVAAGTVAVPTQNGTGTTLCTSDALEQINIAAAPGSGQNRIDLVICRPRGNDLDGGANNDFIFDSIQGVVAASPAVPATPAGTTALAQVYVGGGVAAIGGGNITDVRPGNLAIPIGSPTSTPRGVIAQIVGPATTVSLGTSLTTALTLNAAVVAGRRYRVSGQALVSQQGATGTPYLGLYDSGGYFPSVRVIYAQGLNATVAATGFAAWVFVPTTSATLTFSLQGNTNASTMQVIAGACQIVVEDIGV